MRPLAMLVICASCTPRWVDESHRPQATQDAIATAARDHACPVERVHLRCDASHQGGPLAGEAVAYEPDGVVGSYVDKPMHWAFELEVCGEIRRYRREDDGRYLEDEVQCGMGACTSVEAGCRAPAADAWIARRADPPEDCDRADVDPHLTLAHDRGFIAVTIANKDVKTARVVTADCAKPSLMVAVDGQWFALCGDVEMTALRMRETITVRSGLQIGGRHEVMAIHRDPAASDVWSHCRRSRAIELDVPLSHATLTWSD